MKIKIKLIKISDMQQKVLRGKFMALNQNIKKE